jgi:hypothetical protein
MKLVERYLYVIRTFIIRVSLISSSQLSLDFPGVIDFTTNISLRGGLLVSQSM